MSPEQIARQFHAAAGLDLPGQPTTDIAAEFVSDDVRQAMLDEEVQELREAVAARDLVKIADALADITYVVAGTAVTYGLPFDDVLAEVHRSNMTKFENDGAKVRDDGKIIKGPGYEPPDIAGVLQRAAEPTAEWYREPAGYREAVDGLGDAEMAAHQALEPEAEA